MTELTFVDTNILVYARDARQERKQQRAAEWLLGLWRHRSGRISTQVLSEYYVTVTRKLRPGMDGDAAWDDVLGLMAWKPQPVDREVLIRARDIERRYRTSWWDASIIAAAQLQRCRILLSEDLQDGMVFDQLSVHNPFLTKVEERHADYAEPVRADARHRGRGRPARATDR